MVESDVGAVDACRLANAAINARVVAIDYGDDGPHFVVVRLRARLPRGKQLGHKRKYTGTFADHLHIEGPTPAVLEARELVVAAAEALVAAPAKLEGVDLQRLARDVRASATGLPLKQSLAEVERSNRLAVVAFDEARRRRMNRPLVTRLRGARAYPVAELEDLLVREAGQVAGVLANLLEREGVKTPGYREIYFSLAASLDEARLAHNAPEDWHVDAGVVVDPDAYRRASRARRVALLVDAYAESLARLAHVDRLDEAAIGRAVAALRKDGLDVELWGPGAQNDGFEARVVFRSTGDCATVRLTLVVVDRRARTRREHDLGTHPALWWPHRFARVSLTRTAVRIDAARNERAAAYLEDAPRRVEVRLDELFG